MNKSLVATALALSMGSGISHAVPMTSATFTMLSPPGGTVGVDPTVTGDIGGGTWSVASTTPFFGFVWTAHNGTTFGPGTYTFNTIEGGSYTGVVVGAGQVGGHILFDWSTTANIDVINVWDITDAGDGIFQYTSTDVTAGNPVGPDGIRGLGMIDGAFPGFNANFDFTINPPPTASNFSTSTRSDQSVDITIVPDLTDDPGSGTVDATSINITTGPTNGGVADNGDGSVTYTPDPTFNGTDSFKYTVDDNLGVTSNEATITIDVTNTPPTANNLVTSTLIDTPKNIVIVPDLTSDPDGSVDPGSITIVSAPTHGSLMDEGDGSVTYTPDLGFFSPPSDSFQYTVDDDQGATSNVATVTITVTEVLNNPPDATDVTLSTPEETPLDIDVDSVATDIDLQPLEFQTFDTTSVEGGSVTVDGTNTILTYTPPPAFNGSDSFTYNVTDGIDTSNTATITVNVTAVNDPPVCQDVDRATEENTALLIDIDNELLSTCTDEEDDTLTLFTFENTSTPGGGIITDNGSGALEYSPAPGFVGADSFTYTVSDGTDTTTNTVNITVTMTPNTAPVCEDVSLGTDVDTPLTIDVAADLLSTCEDAQDDPVSLDSYENPTHGTLTDNGAGSLIYTPETGFIGQDSFTYTATDGELTDTRTVTISVGKVFGNFTMLSANDFTTFGGTNDVVASWDGTLNTSVTSTNFNMEMASDADFPFFGFPWFAHHIRVFGPGSYAFDTTCSTTQLEAGIANCGGAPSDFLNITVGAGQIGAHMLFDWNVTDDIDVALIWEEDGTFDNPPPGELYQGPAGPTPPLNAVFELVSRDGDGDGIAGVKMIDGPFIGFQANFNLNFTQSSGGGQVDIPKSSISSPDLGSTGSSGCSISNSRPGLASRSDWLLVGGFIAWLGFLARRRQNQKRH